MEYNKRKAIKEVNNKVNNTSAYQGEVGTSIEVDINSCECVTSWYTNFGTTYIYKMTDSQGNIFTWKTGKCIDTTQVNHIKGSVKAHNDWHGTCQTELTRCKCTSVCV